MAKAPAFQWYPKECDTDENVRLMDDAQFGFYMRCLNHTWLNDGLPENLEDVARIMGRPLAKVKGYWERVGKCFVLINGRWRNKKQEDQRQSARDFQDSRRAAANKRWDAVQEQCISNARASDPAMHVECSASASASASANTPEEKTPTESKRKPVPPSGSTATTIGTRLAETELPDKWAQFALTDCGMDRPHAERVFDRFRDYWISKPGKEARKSDWFATWRNWCRKDSEPRAPTLFENRPAKKTFLESVESGMRQRMEVGLPPL